jgi:hypothetical protein
VADDVCDAGDAACWADQVCDGCGGLLEVGARHVCPAAARPLRRIIVGFHEDEHGDWVAELSCSHDQHIRHRPPFQLRPWVLIEEERVAHIGSEIECPLCENTPIG